MTTKQKVTRVLGMILAGYAVMGVVLGVIALENKAEREAYNDCMNTGYNFSMVCEIQTGHDK